MIDTVVRNADRHADRRPVSRYRRARYDAQRPRTLDDVRAPTAADIRHRFLVHRLCWQACGKPFGNDTNVLIAKGLPIVRG
jgi:hypothetical protein